MQQEEARKQNVSIACICEKIDGSLESMVGEPQRWEQEASFLSWKKQKWTERNSVWNGGWEYRGENRSYSMLAGQEKMSDKDKWLLILTSIDIAMN